MFVLLNTLVNIYLYFLANMTSLINFKCKYKNKYKVLPIIGTCGTITLLKKYHII